MTALSTHAIPERVYTNQQTPGQAFIAFIKQICKCDAGISDTFMPTGLAVIGVEYHEPHGDHG